MGRHQLKSNRIHKTVAVGSSTQRKVNDSTASSCEELSTFLFFLMLKYLFFFSLFPPYSSQVPTTCHFKKLCGKTIHSTILAAFVVIFFMSGNLSEFVIDKYFNVNCK